MERFDADGTWTGLRTRADDNDPNEHCSQHALTQEFLHVVQMRLNYVLAGISCALGLMAWILVTLYNMNGIVSAAQAKMNSVESKVSNNEVSLQVIKARVDSNDEWHRMWELKEQFDHRSKKEAHLP